ncbi:hypothetical protein KOM07_11445, partial [Lentilactobacillus sp. G22-6]|nr:hypothetical protein [Lentilactobacillus dabitei]
VLGTLGHLAGHDVHVHVGVSKGSLWNHGGYSHNGWYDVTKMHGHSSGNAKGKNTKQSSALSKLVSKEIAPQLKWVGKHLQASIDGDAGGSMGNPGGAGVGRWKPYVIKALKANGFSAAPSEISAWLQAIRRESHGVAHITQPGADPDGDGSGPAMGLVQTKRGTFNAYNFKGHDNIFNGYDDLLAGINYAKHHYGRGRSMFNRVAAEGYAKGGVPPTNKASVVGEKGAELFMPNVSGRVFTAKDTAVMATNMMKASLSVGKMLRELERVIKKPAFSASSYRHVAKNEPTVHIETHDKFEFNIGSGVELNQRTIDKMIKQALKGERQNMARQIIEQFGGTK